MYEICAVFLAALAIFSMCASTTEYFQIALTKEGQDNASSSDARTSINHARDNRSMYDAWLSIKQYHRLNYHLNLGPLKDANYQVSPVLDVMDFICLVFFTLDYLARLFTTSRPWRFVTSTSAVFDILAILPDYLESVLQTFHADPEAFSNISVISILRLMRINRIFRIMSRISALDVLLYSLQSSSKDLSLMILFVLMGTVVFGSLMYYADDSRIFTSIPQSFWWAIIMITTVGYGDMVPLTALGQLLGSLTAISGLLLVAFNIPSLVSRFLRYSVLSQYRANRRYLQKRKSKWKGLGIPVEDIDVHDNRTMIYETPLHYV